MKKTVFFCFLLLASCLSTQAQALRFGFFSYNHVLNAMPEYQQSQQQLAALKVQYEQELTKAKQEFQSKYEDFLDGLSTFAPSIRAKRQAELEQMLQQNEQFRDEAARLLKQAEDEANTSLRDKIYQMLQQISREQGLAFVLNTDDNQTPYVNPELGVDLTLPLLNALTGEALTVQP